MLFRRKSLASLFFVGWNGVSTDFSYVFSYLSTRLTGSTLSISYSQMPPKVLTRWCFFILSLVLLISFILESLGNRALVKSMLAVAERALAVQLLLIYVSSIYDRYEIHLKEKEKKKNTAPKHHHQQQQIFTRLFNE